MRVWRAADRQTVIKRLTFTEQIESSDAALHIGGCVWSLFHPAARRTAISAIVSALRERNSASNGSYGFPARHTVSTLRHRSASEEKPTMLAAEIIA